MNFIWSECFLWSQLCVCVCSLVHKFVFILFHTKQDEEEICCRYECWMLKQIILCSHIHHHWSSKHQRDVSAGIDKTVSFHFDPDFFWQFFFTAQWMRIQYIFTDFILIFVCGKDFFPSRITRFFDAVAFHNAADLITIAKESFIRWQMKRTRKIFDLLFFSFFRISFSWNC